MLLRQAGLAFEVRDSLVDEDEMKKEFAASDNWADTDALALKLAGEKALAVSRTDPGALVIGADQILSCDGRRYDKPRDMAEARANLETFRGRTHILHSGVALAKDGAIVWGLGDRARLTMRGFTPEFLDGYLAALGEKVRSSVGCYQLEGPGIQLFERIEGDYFTILGLPLLPLLAALRHHGIILP
jgi:septum formation protein